MIYRGFVTLPDGKVVGGELDAQYVGSVRDWWNGGGRWVVDEERMMLWWGDGKLLKREEADQVVVVEVDFRDVREMPVKHFVMEQILTKAGEPYDAI